MRGDVPTSIMAEREDDVRGADGGVILCAGRLDGWMRGAICPERLYSGPPDFGGWFTTVVDPGEPPNE